MRTCTSCRDEECQTKSNLDENLQKKKLLTSGYFIPLGISYVKKKPPGKCSHGGSFDGSQKDEPIGGINKDKLKSIHGHLHYRAAHMAYEATVKILTDFWKQIGNDAFALFLTLKAKLNSLVISIDTACSIADYVEFAKKVSIDIVNQHNRSEFAPHNYILTSFNGDRAELVVNSRNPVDLTNAIQKLNSCQRTNTTAGGMYYHSLIEGLKQCEYATVIYTFTDLPARDAYLKYQARALQRSKRAVIYSFMGQKMRARMLQASTNMVGWQR
jgi:von Willebrand factor A domain-containing protein 7